MQGKEKKRMKLWDEAPGYDFIEEIDLPEMHSWFLDGTHSVPPWTPLFGWNWVRYCSHGTKAAAAELSIPTCKGWEMRLMDGGSYNAFDIVRDKNEIAEREAKFQQALRPYIENFDALWETRKKTLLDIYNNLKALDVDKASNIELYHHNYDLIMAYMEMWENHFQGMYTSYSAWLLLEQLCKKRFGIKDQDPEFQDMLRGYDNKLYQMDKQLWEFGQLAIEMRLDDIFKENEPQVIMPKLEQTAKGKEWLKQFMNYLKTDEVGGWRMRRMCELTEPYWLEDPSTPIGEVKNYITKGAVYILEDTRKELSRKREESIAGLIQKVPSGEKGFYESLIRLAGKASSYSEEHNLYCELMVGSLMRRGYLAIGRRLAQKGTIDKPDDVFFLNPDEIDRVIMVPERHDMRLVTRRRRSAWEEWQTRPNPPFLTDRGSIDEAVAQDLLPSRDAIAIKIVVGEIPEVKPELEADMFGLCGCPGKAEGRARVAICFEDLNHVQPGEILVCPGTNPAWTRVFGIINGLITDRGGTLSHAAIVGREHGVPTIVNTFQATAKIKTGQRIRIDATQGAVYIIEK